MRTQPKDITIRLAALATYFEDVRDEQGYIPETIRVAKSRITELEAEVARLKKIEDAMRFEILGWRECDHPEWFCRKKAVRDGRNHRNV